MNRGAGLTEEEVPHLTSHVPFFERFEGKTEPLALKHMGADPKRAPGAHRQSRVGRELHRADDDTRSPATRCSRSRRRAASCHPSTVRPISMAGASFKQFHAIDDLEQAWQAEGPPRLLLITPISASKRHIDLARRAACARVAACARTRSPTWTTRTWLRAWAFFASRALSRSATSISRCARLTSTSRVRARACSSGVPISSRKSARASTSSGSKRRPDSTSASRMRSATSIPK